MDKRTIFEKHNDVFYATYRMGLRETYWIMQLLCVDELTSHQDPQLLLEWTHAWNQKYVN